MTNFITCTSVPLRTRSRCRCNIGKPLGSTVDTLTGTRYLPAEVVGTVCAVAGAYVAFLVLADRAVAAIVGTMAENVGFYGVMAVVEWRRRRARSVRRTALALFAEFGPAEALDSLLVRPACMYLGPLLTGGIASGSLLGKLAADGVFYAVAIVGYEIMQRRKPPTDLGNSALAFEH
jgi:O-antigen/teichoic acid export membrane protein